MSFDLPLNVARDLEEYARAECISPADAAVKLIQSGLRAKRRKAEVAAPLTDAEMSYLDQMFPALDALDDVTEDQWKRIDEYIGRVKQAGLSARA